MAGPGLRFTLFWQLGRVPGMRSRMRERLVFDNGNKLNICRSEFLAQKSVHVQRPSPIEAMDACQCVERNAMALKQLGRGKYFVKGGPSSLGDPVMIMNITRTIDAQSHQKTMGLEELAPPLVEQ